MSVFFTVNVMQTQNAAYAFALPPLPVALPASLSGAGVVAAGGDAAVIAATAGEVAAGGAAVVAAAPVAVAAGAVLLVGGAVYLGWKWHTGHTGTEYDASVYQTGGLGDSTTETCPSGYPSCTGLGMAKYTSDALITAPSSRRVTIDWTPIGHTTGASYSMEACLAPSAAGAAGSACVTMTSNTASSGTISYSSVTYPSGVGVIKLRYNQASFATSPPNPLFVWTLQGTPNPAPAPSGQNPVTTTPKSQCSNGTTVTGSPVTYTGSATDATLPALLLPACPAGTTRTGAQFPTTASGVTSPAQPLADWTAPTIPSGFPDCNIAGKVCQLNLFRVGFGTPATRTACGADGACEAWQTQTIRQGAVRTVKTLVAVTIGGVAYAAGDAIPEQGRFWDNGDHAECWWGPYEVAVDECTVVPTEPRTTGDITLTDPDGRRCYPKGLAALNPVEWVVKPLKCLFIPTDEAVQAAGDSISDAWAGTAPATIGSKVAEVAAPIVALKDDTGPADCQGPSFVIPQLPAMHSTLTLHPLSTCNELTTYMLGIYMPIATALIYIGGFFAGTRVILKSFNLDTPEEV